MVYTNHHDALEFFASMLRPKVYVELGVYHGTNLRRVAPYCGRAIGVDRHRYEGIDYSGLEMYFESTESFFERCLQENIKIDMLFIDADHSFSGSALDFTLFAKLVRQDGMILLHDTYPASAEMTVPELSGEVWRLAENIRRYEDNAFEIVTLPVSPGISIIRKAKKQLPWLDEENKTAQQ